MEEVRTAVRFVHSHADEYGIDTNRVGVSGISSGAHLSLMVAGSQDSPVRAVAAIAPPTDLANWGKPGFILTDDPQLAIFVPALGFDPRGPRNGIEALLKQLSPITYVNSKYPPTLIVHGDADKVVPLQQAQAMDQALAKAGDDHKLVVIPGGGHDDKTFGPGLMRSLQDECSFVSEKRRHDLEPCVSAGQRYAPNAGQVPSAYLHRLRTSPEQRNPSLAG